MNKLKRPTLFNTQVVKPFMFKRQHPKRLQTEYLQESGSLPTNPNARDMGPAINVAIAAVVILGLIGLIVLTVINVL